MSYQYQNYLENIQKVISQYPHPDDFLKEYIQKNPDKAKKIQQLLNKGIDKNTLVNAIVYKESQPSIFQRFKSGAYTGYLDLLKSLDAVSNLIGIENNPEYQSRVSQIEQEQQKYAVNTPELTQISSPKQALQWGAYSAGSLLEFLGELAAGEGLTSALTKGARLAPSVLRALKILPKGTEDVAKATEFAKGAEKLLTKSATDYNKKELLKEATSKISSQQPLILPHQIGSAYSEGNRQHPLTSILGGTLSSLLYTASPFELVKGLTDKAASDAIADNILKLVSPKSDQTLTQLERAFPRATSTAINTLKSSVEQSLLLGSANVAEQLGGTQQINPQEVGQSALLGALFGTLGGSIKGLKEGKELKTKLDTAKQYSSIIDRIDKRLPKLQENKDKITTKLIDKDLNKLTSLDISTLTPEDIKVLQPKIEQLSQKLSLLKEGVEQNKIQKIIDLKNNLSKIGVEISKEPTEQLKTAQNIEQKLGKNKPVPYKPNKIEKPIEISNVEKEVYSKIPLGEKPKSLKNYNELIHKKVIEDNFDKGIVLKKNKKPDWKATLSYYKSANISNEDLLNKFGEKIPKKEFDKDLAKAYVFGNIKPDENNIHSLIQRAVSIYNENPEAVKPVLNELKSKFNSIVRDKVNEYKDKFSNIPDDKIKNLISNIKDIKLSKNEQPKDLLDKIAKYTYLTQEAQRLKIKDTAKLQQITRKLTNAYLSSIKSLPQEKRSAIPSMKASKIPATEEQIKVPKFKQEVEKLKSKKSNGKKSKSIEQPKLNDLDLKLKELGFTDRDIKRASDSLKQSLIEQNISGKDYMITRTGSLRKKPKKTIKPTVTKEPEYKKPLKDLGFTDSQIKRIKPEVAKEIIDKKLSPKDVSIKRDGTLKYIKKESSKIKRPSEKDLDKFEKELTKLYKKHDILSTEGDLFLSSKDEQYRSAYIVFPKDKEEQPDVSSFDAYLKNAGINKNHLDRKSLEHLKNLYEIRKQEKEKTREYNLKTLKETIDVLSEIEKDKRIRDESFSKLSAGFREAYRKYNSAVDIISKQLEKDFDFTANKILTNIFGEKLAQKIKVKSISQLTLDDLGGRENVIKVFKEDYGKDLSKLSDKQLEEYLKNINAATLFEPKEKSALIVIAKNSDNPIGMSLYHEIFHIAEKYKLLPDKDIKILKDYAERLDPDDPRSWDEKIADEFAIYTMNRNLIPNSFVKNIFEKIRRFILKLKLKLKPTPENIFDKILAGEYKPTEDYLAYMHYRNFHKINKPIKFSASATVEQKFDELITTLSHSQDTNLKDKFIKSTMEALNAVKKFFTDFMHGIAPELDTPELIRTKEAIRMLASIKQYAHTKATEDLKEITKGFTKYDKDLMEKYLILKDLKWSLDKGIQTFANVKIQWKGVFKEPKDIEDLLNKISKKVEENEKIQRALKKRKEIYTKIINYLKEREFIDKDEFLDIDNYFHRITESVFNDRIRLHTTFQAQVPKLETLMERKNSFEPYITEYIYSEYEALAQFHLLKKYSDILRQLEMAVNPVKRELINDLAMKVGADKVPKKLSQMLTLARRFEDLREKYKNYLVKPIKDITHFYTVYSINRETAEKILEEGLTEDILKQLPQEIRQQLALRKYDKELMIHKDALKALTDIVKLENPAPIVRFIRANIAAFKKYVLFTPFRILKYSFNNLVSDIDFAMALSPKITFKYAPKAAKDLYLYYFKNGAGLDKQTLKDIKNAEELLVLGTNITSEEVEQIARIEDFKQLMGIKNTPNDMYWNVITKANNYRESILRLAAFRHYIEELRKVQRGEKQLEDVVSVVDVEIAKSLLKQGDLISLAAKMAREGIGDYGDITPNGQWLRRNMIPFWSWTEINMRRYFKLFKLMGRMLKKGSTMEERISGATAAAVLFARMTLLYTMINAYNYFFFPNVAKQLNDTNNGRLFIILGQDDDGMYRTLNLNAALTDFLDWGGLANIPALAEKISTGRITPVDIIKGIPENIINKVVNMSVPIQKTVIETMAGISFYPDVFHPRALRDRTKHLLSLYGLSVPYDIFFSGKPAPKSERGLLNILRNAAMRTLFTYSDPNQINYYSAKDIIRQWADDHNIQTSITFPTAKSEYAFYYKQALIYGDAKSAVNFLSKYLIAGGTLKGLHKSLLSMNPLNSLPKKYRGSFWKDLRPEEKDTIMAALNWYKKIILRHGKFSNQELLAIKRKSVKIFLQTKRR